MVPREGDTGESFKKNRNFPKGKKNILQITKKIVSSRLLINSITWEADLKECMITVLRTARGRTIPKVENTLTYSKHKCAWTLYKTKKLPIYLRFRSFSVKIFKKKSNGVLRK